MFKKINFFYKVCKKINSYFEIFFLIIKYKSLIKNKNCFVLGSAPLTKIKSFKKNMILICVHGSPVTAKLLLKKEPDFTVVDTGLIDFNNKQVGSRKYIIKKKILQGKNLGHLISVTSNQSSTQAKPEVLQAKTKSFFYLSKYSRSFIVKKACKNNLLEKNNTALVSTGIFAIAFAFFLGANKVYFNGMSLIRNNKLTHFYKKSKNKKKIIDFNSRYISNSHSLADLAFIVSAKINNLHIETDEPHYQIVMDNWGGKKI